MGWFIGLLPKRSTFHESEVRGYLHSLKEIAKDAPALSVERKEMIFLGGGLPDTFRFHVTNTVNCQQGWAVCGIGIKNDSGSFSIMRNDDWSNLLSNEPSLDEMHKINGHYAVLSWNKNRFEIFCDALELRRAYVVETEKFFLISTRLDWIVSIVPDSVLKIERLASGWSLVNSVSDECFIGNVIRVGPSGHVRIMNGKITHTWQHWEPGAPEESTIAVLLKQITVLPLKDEHKITLGLSGGMDSRTLLSVLCDLPKESWQVHSCGDADNLDIKIAKRIANELNVRHEIKYYQPQELKTVDSVVRTIKEYALHTEMAESLFGYPKLELFSSMAREGYWMVDGGYGELLRRSYGNKLLLAGRGAVRERSASGILKYLLLPRSPIFNHEIQQSFLFETHDQLQHAIDTMPDHSAGDFGNWVDLFHIRYRLRNYAGNSQSLYDCSIPGYMPFAQPAMLSTYFGLASRQRCNNKLNRKIIADGEARLQRIPLLTSGAVVPYWTSRNILFSRLIGRIKRKVVPNKANLRRPFAVKRYFS